MARSLYNDTIITVSGAGVPTVLVAEAIVTVYEQDGVTEATIYQTVDTALEQTNPFEAVGGRVSFYAETAEYIVSYHDTHVPSRFADVSYAWESVSARDGGLPINLLADASLTAAKLEVGQRHYAGDLKASLRAADHSSWLICDGRSILRADYPALYSEIGVTFGSVDGTHFSLPDYRGRAIYGLGTHADVNAMTDNDGLAVANRTPKHSHHSPWPFGENGGGGNFIAALKAGTTALAAIGYALRDRVTDNSVSDSMGGISRLNAGSASSHDSNLNGDPITDVMVLRDVESTSDAGTYGVANIFVHI